MRQCAMPKCVKWVYAEHELALHRLRNAIRSNENNQTLVYRVCLFMQRPQVKNARKQSKKSLQRKSFNV